MGITAEEFASFTQEQRDAINKRNRENYQKRMARLSKEEKSARYKQIRKAKKKREYDPKEAHNASVRKYYHKNKTPMDPQLKEQQASEASKAAWNLRMSPEQKEVKRKAIQEEIKELELAEANMMAAMVQYKTDNLIEFFTRPNPPQEKMLKAWKDEVFKVFTFTGGNRMGKTTMGVILAISTAIGYYPWDKEPLIFPHRKPRKIRYVGQDWEKQIKAVVIPELQKWWPKNRKLKTKKNNTGVEALWTDEKTGSVIEIMSNLQPSELHEGWYGDLVIYDEPPRRPVRVANARGLVDRRGRELFCMTLLKEAWVDREVIKALDATGRPDITVFNVHGEIYDNEGFGITKEGIAQFAKTLSEEEKDARLRGIPSYMSGLVYPQYDRRTHLVERFVVPISWVVDIAIDIHPREKQAILFCAVAPDGNKYLVNEIWAHGDGTWVGEEIVRCVRMNTYRVNRIIIDPLSKGDKNNYNTVFDKVQLVLWQHELALETASKDKTSGLLLVRNHLLGPNKVPSLFIFNDMIRTIFEIEGYMYDKETQNPQDKDDHMMENLYRLTLLDTVWYDYQSSDDADSNENVQGRSKVGGY